MIKTKSGSILIFLAILSIPLFATRIHELTKSNFRSSGSEGTTLNGFFTLIPDSSRKVSALTDTSWSKAAESLSTSGPAKGKQPGDTLKNKPGRPGKFVDPYRPQIMLDGLKKAQAGDLKGAIEDFDSAIRKNPRNFNAYFYRAKAKIEYGDKQGAMEDIDLAIKNKGDEAIYYYYRGKMLSDANQTGKALADFDMAIRLKRNFTDALNYRGVERAKLGMHKEAIQDYDSAIISNPSYTLGHYNKGTSEAALGDFSGAILSFAKSIELDTTHVLSYLNRGNCHVQLKEYTLAIDDFTSAISLDPKNSDAYFNRGAAHYLSGDNLMCPDWQKAASMRNDKARSYLEKYCK